MTDKSKPKKPVLSVLISLGIYVIILALAYYFLSRVFHNDSNVDKSDYVEQGIVIFVSVTSALISFITNRITSYNTMLIKKNK